MINNSIMLLNILELVIVNGYSLENICIWIYDGYSELIFFLDS